MQIKVLVIGQTPPPYHGQAMSIAQLVNAKYDDLEIHHTRMHYSQSFNEIGNFKIKKVLHLFRVVSESVYKTLRYKIDVIHYPPGAEKISLLRDIATLLVLRCLRRKIVLVFHASGLSEKVPHWSVIPSWFFGKAFFFHDAAIQTSSLNPPDGTFVRAKKVHIVPNGLADEFERFREKRPNAVPVILYVGVVREDKGIDVLIEASHHLKERGHRFVVKVVGEFGSDEYRQKLSAERSSRQLEPYLEFLGPKVGDDKWKLYREADIFCFPSYFVAESFGNVIVEAMMFELPVVATRWRGIPSVVDEGVTGFLADIKNAQQVADNLERLLEDETLRTTMGCKGRERYLQKFTVNKYLDGYIKVFLEVAAAK